MRMKSRAFALAAGLLTAVPALADHPSAGYHKTDGSWTVQAWKDGLCLAYNRPGAEIDAAPFNTLWLIGGPGTEDIVLQVFFWPGSFVPDDAVNLKFNNDRGFSVSYDAVAVEGHSARTKTKVRISDIRRLSESELLTIDTPKIQQELVFDITSLRRVLDDLTRCIAASK